jgi:hypothetical protein
VASPPEQAVSDDDAGIHSHSEFPGWKRDFPAEEAEQPGGDAGGSARDPAIGAFLRSLATDGGVSLAGAGVPLTEH